MVQFYSKAGSEEKEIQSKGDKEYKMSTYMDLVDVVDNVPLDFDFNTLYKLYLPDDPRPHGFLLPEIVATNPWTSDFEISHTDKSVRLNAPSASMEREEVAAHCTQVFGVVVRNMLAQKLYPKLLSKESEPYLIMGTSPPVHMQRFASPMFGIASRGAHMTVYVIDESASHGIRIWVAMRSKKSWTYPGKLDTSVAGGVKATDTPLDCIVAESEEEAGLDMTMVRRCAKAVGLITYVGKGRSYGTITPTALFVFDLKVRSDVVLRPVDNEVERFDLMTVEEIKEAMFAGRFKPNCNVVMMDFFMRHGIMAEDECNGIRERLHRKLPVPTSPEEGW